MFNFLKKINPFGGARTKGLTSHQLFKLMFVNGHTFKEFELKQFATEGYKKNIVAYIAIRDIARSAAKIPWLLYDRKGQEVEQHELLDLLNNPHPLFKRSAFYQVVYSQYMLFGNTYLLGVGSSAIVQPRELWPLKPYCTEIEIDPNGFPKLYRYNAEGLKSITYPVEKNRSPVLHWKTFNPTDDIYGMPMLQAGAMSVDRHNESLEWNLSLLRNGACPTGGLRVKATEMRPTGRLGDDQYERIKSEIEDKFSGSKNAGRPLLLEEDIEWQQLSLSPKDMDWLESTSMSARDIANCLGYPPTLLGLPDNQTYNNQREARQALWEDTVIPLAESLRDEFQGWLVPSFDEGLRLEINLDQLEILQYRKQQEWERVKDADWLTVNEKRDACGYSPIDGGDVILVNSNKIPLLQAFEGEE